MLRYKMIDEDAIMGKIKTVFLLIGLSRNLINELLASR